MLSYPGIKAMALRTKKQSTKYKPSLMTQKAIIKFHSLLFVYLNCTPQNTNLDRKGTGNYNLSNTGQNLDKQKWNYFF